jgi:glyoxylase-like metal-dependent hydrolase (beta-lactamase superfamily II)
MLQIHYFTFSPIQENTYLLYNEKSEACIIDPGCYTASEERELAAFVEQNGLQVTMLLQTHFHLDHIFGLKWAAEKYGLQPMMHPGEVPVLERGPAAGMMWGLPFEAYSGPVQFIADKQVLRLGDDELEVIFAPGHAPGHVCYYSRSQGFVIGGDVLFRESIGRTDLPGGNHQQLLESIRTRLFVLDEQTIVYPGHGPHTTIGHEKQYNPFL